MFHWLSSDVDFICWCKINRAQREPLAALDKQSNPFGQLSKRTPEKISAITQTASLLIISNGNHLV